MYFQAAIPFPQIPDIRATQWASQPAETSHMKEKKISPGNLQTFQWKISHVKQEKLFSKKFMCKTGNFSSEKLLHMWKEKLFFSEKKLHM